MTRPLAVPLEVDELTAEWFSAAFGRDVERVEVLDRHSGTTGRARLALRGGAGVPATRVREAAAVRRRAARVRERRSAWASTEARFYRDLAGEVRRARPEAAVRRRTRTTTAT